MKQDIERKLEKDFFKNKVRNDLQMTRIAIHQEEEGRNYYLDPYETCCRKPDIIQEIDYCKNCGEFVSEIEEGKHLTDFKTTKSITNKQKSLFYKDFEDYIEIGKKFMQTKPKIIEWSDGKSFAFEKEEKKEVITENGRWVLGRTDWSDESFGRLPPRDQRNEWDKQLEKDFLNYNKGKSLIMHQVKKDEETVKNALIKAGIII